MINIGQDHGARERFVERRVLPVRTGSATLVPGPVGAVTGSYGYPPTCYVSHIRAATHNEHKKMSKRTAHQLLHRTNRQRHTPRLSLLRMQR